MITQFSLKNFKCFKNEQEFDFSSINLFTGYNGRGKSSVIQALLLLSQSMKRDPEMRTLCINGDFVALDLFEDILNDQQSKVSFSVKTDNLKLDMLQLDYECNKNNERIGSLLMKKHCYLQLKVLKMMILYQRQSDLIEFLLKVLN